MNLKFSKAKQVNRKKKTKTGSKKEAPVQSFINDYLKLLHLDFFRIPDGFWRYVHNPINRIQGYFKKVCSDSLAGWPDNMVYEVLNDKYLIAMPLEAKSATGTFNGNKQRNMAKRLNYQVPRSPEQAKEMIDTFIKDIDKYRELIQIEKTKE